MTTLVCTKKALIRDTETPVGFPGKMHINCFCGNTLDVPNPFSAEYVPCACGYVFDSRGYVHNTASQEASRV